MPHLYLLLYLWTFNFLALAVVNSAAVNTEVHVSFWITVLPRYIPKSGIALSYGNCVFIFLGSKITADGDCRHEIERYLLLGRKAMTNLDSILKSRDIALPTKVCLIKGMVFPVVTYRCKSWTINKAECQRIHALNRSAGEDSWESLGQQGDQISQF